MTPLGRIDQSGFARKHCDVPVAAEKINVAASVFFFRGLLLVSYDIQLSHFVS